MEAKQPDDLQEVNIVRLSQYKIQYQTIAEEPVGYQVAYQCLAVEDERKDMTK